MGMVFVATLAAVGQGQPVSPRDLAMALAARDMRKRLEAGDAQGAEALEAQVRARGGIPPSNVSAQSPSGQIPLTNQREVILKMLTEGKDPALYEPLLEELVARNPLDFEVRSWLLLLAERRGDQVAIQRHRAHLPHARENFPWWKIGIAGLIIIGVVWQAWELWHDWRRFRISFPPQNTARS